MPHEPQKPAVFAAACHTTTDPSGYCESHKSEGWKQYKPDNPVISAATVRSGTVSARVS